MRMSHPPFFALKLTIHEKEGKKVSQMSTKLEEFLEDGRDEGGNELT